MSSQPNSELDSEKLRIALAQRDMAEARIQELEAKVAILDRCNEHVECLCRGDVMDMKDHQRI
jgi:hypothetical protein